MSSIDAHLPQTALPYCRRDRIGKAQVQGRRVHQICEELSLRARNDQTLVADSADLALKQGLGSLVELIARRQSQAVPLATAGRVALADLAGDRCFAEQAVRDCAQSILLLGL